MPTLLFALLLSVTIATPPTDEPPFRDDFLDVWARARAYTMQVAEAMPEAHYDTPMVDSVMTFRAQLLHLVRNFQWITSKYLREVPFPREEEGWEELSKQETMALLARAFDYVETTARDFPAGQLADSVRFGGVEVNKERLFWVMRDHNTHHRAQCIVFLRMQGIQPPRYRGW
ncbi:MAG: DinB family protein [Catalinimonas sp.]